MDDLSNLIKNCISEQFKNIKEFNSPKPSIPEKEILSIEEVKDLLGLSSTTLWKYRKDGTLPANKIGSRVYYSRSVIHTFLNNTT